jgi:hypothetical protein
MKKVLIGVGVLLLLVVGGLVYVYTNLDAIVKSAIETYGSEATKTAVRVDEVKLTLQEGKAKIAGLTVANPPGYTDPNIFSLGSISTKVDISSLNKNPIIIDESTISAPAVVYEINKDGVANADVLKKNLGAGGGGGEKAAPAEEKGEGLKMIIRKLVVEGTSAKVRIAALKQDQTVKLQRIVMTDIGKKSGGASAAEVANQISSKMLGNLKNAVTKIGVQKYLGKSADTFKQQMQQQMQDKVGGATGGDAGKMLKGILGN